MQGDLAIVGTGPVGLACAIEAKRAGLEAVVFDKGALCNTLVRWPSNLTFFSTAELIEIGGHPFPISGPKPTRREALVYYRKVAEREGLDLHLFERVTSVRPVSEGFALESPKGAYTFRKLILATGFYDHPNLLGVPGEDLPKVTHYYTEPYGYAGTDVLVVGGKNSAAEAALELYRHGVRVTMAVREKELGHSVKYWLKPDIENRIREGAIRAHFETEVARIDPDSVTLRKGSEELVSRNDFVLALTGYHPDFDFLASCGVNVRADGSLPFDESTMETPVPGLYLAGVVAGGADIGRFFIENGRWHARQIIDHILAMDGQKTSQAPRPARVGPFQEGD